MGDDPFVGVGRADITAHVDITALERAARASGLQEVGRTTQARFLADLGLGDLLWELGHDPATDASDYVEGRTAVARLLDPRHLGGFAVVAWRRPDRMGTSGAPVGTLPGFRTA